MRVHRVAMIVGLLAATAPIGTSARAQGRSAQQDAHVAFAAGEHAFQRGAYTEALAAFDQAFHLVPHDAVRFNIAVCLERLQRYHDAWVQYRAAAESTTLDDSERRRATASSERIRRELGALAIEGHPAGAPVTVDGEVRCSLPCRLVLDPRAYEVRLGESAPRAVRIERGAEITLDLGGARTEPGTATPATSPARSERGDANGPGWLTWIGGAVGVAGIGGTVGFGLRTASLGNAYTSHPSEATRDEGLLFRGLTNASIAVGIVGVGLVAIDLIFLAPRRREATP